MDRDGEWAGGGARYGSSFTSQPDKRIARFWQSTPLVPTEAAIRRPLELPFALPSPCTMVTSGIRSLEVSRSEGTERRLYEYKWRGDMTKMTTSMNYKLYSTYTKSFET